MRSNLVNPDDSTNRMRALLHAFGIIFLAFAIGIVLFSIVLNVLALAGIAVPDDSVRQNVVSAVVQFVGFILVGVGYLWYRKDTALIKWGLPSLRQVGIVVGGFVELYLLNFAAGILITILEVESAQNRIVTLGQQDPELFLYMIPITILLVAPGEELIFRGIVQGWFRRAYGVVPGIVLASVIFGGVHLVALEGSGVWIYVAVAAALGGVLGALYEYTDNLVVPIVVHGLWNTFLFTVQYLIATGYVTAPS